MTPGDESHIVTGEGGWTGRLEPAHALLAPGGVSVPQVLVRVDNGGPALVLPARTLEQRGANTYYLPFTREALEAYAGTANDPAEETVIMKVPDFSAGDPEVTAAAATAAVAPVIDLPPTALRPDAVTQNVESVVVPLIGEELDVTKREIETGVVRVHKTVSLREETVDEPLMRQEVQVERVTVNRVLEGGPPPIRHEGNTMIIPLLEEVLVVEKRLMLREELRVTRMQQEFHAPQQVTLRREEITVDRVPSEGREDSHEPDPAVNSQTQAGQGQLRGQEMPPQQER